MALRYVIHNPKGVYLEGEASSILAPLPKGPMSFSESHAEFIGALRQGILKINEISAKKRYFAIYGGTVWMKGGRLTVTAERIEEGTSIDLSRAIKAKERADDRLLNRSEDIDIKRAEAALSRALLRIKVSNLSSGGAE